LRILKDVLGDDNGAYPDVSPITIRLRILKEEFQSKQFGAGAVSPITIRLRILKADISACLSLSRACFTHHDPLEDTER